MNVYQPSNYDTKSNKLVKTNSGYRSYSRLVEIKFKRKHIKWRNLYEFPQKYWAFNWEGIAVYKDGYFIINDKFTPHPLFNLPYFI